MTTNDVQEEKIKENERRILWLETHYNNFNSEMGEVKTDVKWIKKALWWLIGVVLSGFGGTWAMIITHIMN